MIRLGGFRIYCGTKAWRWRMYGIGLREVWFLGFSYAYKDKLREAFDQKYQHLYDLAERCGL